MLRQRILTGTILFILMSLAVLKLPFASFNLFTLIIVLLAGWEWCQFIPLTKWWSKALFLLLLFVLSLSTFVVRVNEIFYVALVWWGLALFWLWRYPHLKEYWDRKWILILLGTQILIPCWLGLNLLRMQPQGNVWVWCFLLVVCSADITAYFVGKAWGRTPLAPTISPKKTREGFYGGLVGSVITLIPFLSYFNIPIAAWWQWIVLALLVSAVSVAGDLVESMFKRNRNLKDSGTWLPGHGGLLDRLDSICAAAPVFIIGFKQLMHNMP